MKNIVLRHNADRTPGISAPVHHLPHDRRGAWIRTIDNHLGNGLGRKSRVLRDGWANICRVRNGDREAVAGHLPAPHCCQAMASYINLDLDDQLVDCVGDDRHHVLDPTPSV